MDRTNVYHGLEVESENLQEVLDRLRDEEIVLKLNQSEGFSYYFWNTGGLSYQNELHHKHVIEENYQEHTGSDAVSRIKNDSEMWALCRPEFIEPSDSPFDR